MIDGDGTIPDGLLDELAVIADEHAAPDEAEGSHRVRRRARAGAEE